MKNEAKAYAKNMDVAPRKARSVADLVRGRSAGDAEAELSVRRERAAHPILKLLRSAVANARSRNLDPDTLFVKEIRVDKGITLKRILPRAQGAASPIHKVRSHILITLGAGKGPARFKLAQRAVKAIAKKEGKRETAKSDDTIEPQKPKVETKSPFTHRLFRRKTG
ncbi:MAG: 50S ribosomal protein L22 [Candidatus Colwellbacteria bacterium]|nr:50S ribosomal protein L22 [Candidatus Colwellbacteria bacterium]